METVLDGGGQLEREMRPDRMGASATGSILLHAALFGGVLFYGFFTGFHHNWGNPGPGSAIQVTLNSAAIPLPNDQPKNDNVLPSEKPSPAPAPPAPKAAKQIDGAPWFLMLECPNIACGVSAESCGEHRQPAEKPLLRVVQEIVAPVHRCPQCPVPW